MSIEQAIAERCATFTNLGQSTYDVVLDLSNLGLTTIPEQLFATLIGDDGEDCEYGIDLSGNPISDFSALHKLAYVQYLDVSNTALTADLATLLTDEGKLPGVVTGIRLRGLGMSALPERFDTSDVEFNIFDISDNQFTQIPEVDFCCGRLLFANNPITEVPDWVYEHEDIGWLDIRGTECTVDGERIQEAGHIQHVLAAKEQIENLEDEDVLYDTNGGRWFVEYTLEEFCDDGDIDFSDLELEHVPSFVSEAEYAQFFNLEDNPKLTEIPDCIGKFDELDSFCISNTGVTSLPDSMADISFISNVDMSNTPIDHIPECLADIYMKSADFSHTNISELPRVQLEVRPNLKNCQITQLPNDFAEMYPYEILDLTGNKLTSLPDDLGKVTELIVDGNNISELPASTAKWNLRKLSIRNNQLTSLPSDIGDNVLDLKITNNPFVGLSDEVDLTANAALLIELGVTTALSKSNEDLYKALTEGSMGQQYEGLAPETEGVGQPGEEHNGGNFVTEYEYSEWNQKYAEALPEGSIPIYVMLLSNDDFYYATRPEEGWAVYRRWGVAGQWTKISSDISGFLKGFEEWVDYE